MANTAFEIEIDEITLAGARRGDMRACEKIYRQFQRPAFTVAVRVCHCREMAQDVTQEAFITAFRRIGQFRGDSPFWGWLRQLSRSTSVGQLLRAVCCEQAADCQLAVPRCQGSAAVA